MQKTTEIMYIFRTTNFIVRAWRNWCKRNHTNLTKSITTNAYICLELNAHAIILLVKECRDNEVPEQFVLSAFSSQPCEQLFRELRSMATSNQTVVNFSIKELTEKLKRIFMKRHIMYKHRDIIKFPFMEKLQRRCNGLTTLPSDIEMIEAVEKAQTVAYEILVSLGLSRSTIEIQDSIGLGINVPDIEFIDVGLTEDSTDSDEHSIDSSSLPKFDLHCEELSDSENVEYDDNMSNQAQSHELVYDAAKIFKNFNDDLQLKSSRTGNKHTFKIKDAKGDIKNVKKSTLLWMLTAGRHKLSTDRLRRFQQTECRSRC